MGISHPHRRGSPGYLMGLDPFTAGRGCLGDIAFLLLGHLIGRSLLWDSLITARTAGGY
jgi:hypothetical protein